MYKRKFILFIISFWILFYFINNYIWLKNSPDFPIEPQDAKFYGYMAVWTNLIKHNDFTMMKLLLAGGGTYPPLYLLPAVFSSLAFGGNYLFHIMLNIAYFTLLLVSVYLLAKEFFNERCAVISVCLLSLYPATYGLSRKFFIEFGMMWLVVSTILMLAKAKFFTVRKYSVLLGIFLGLGLMTKDTFALFVLGPLVYIGFKTVKGVENINRPTKPALGKALFNLFLSLLICFAIAGYRYCRLSIFYHHLVECFAESTGFTPMFYVKDLIDHEVSLIFFILFIASLAYFLIIRRNEKDQKVILLLWFFIPFLYHSLMLHEKETRFILPYLPAVAIISAACLDSIRQKGFGISMICFLITAGLLQYYHLSYGMGLGFGKLRIDKDRYTSYKDVVHKPAYQEKKFFDDIISIVSSNIDLKEKPRVLWLVDSQYQENFNKHVWNDIVWLGKLPINLKLLNIGDDLLLDFTESVGKTDSVIYIGDADLKDKDVLNNYIDNLFQGNIELIKRHPPLAASPAIYIEILKGNYSSLFPAGYLRSVKPKVEIAFSSFELVNFKKLYVDPSPNIYIYIRKK